MDGYGRFDIGMYGGIVVVAVTKYLWVAQIINLGEKNVQENCYHCPPGHCVHWNCIRIPRKECRSPRQKLRR